MTSSTFPVVGSKSSSDPLRLRRGRVYYFLPDTSLFESMVVFSLLGLASLLLAILHCFFGGTHSHITAVYYVTLLTGLICYNWTTRVSGKGDIRSEPKSIDPAPLLTPSSWGRVWWTVRKRRRMEKLRFAKSRKDHRELITRLRLIFDSSTPGRWREALASSLVSSAAKCSSWHVEEEYRAPTSLGVFNPTTFRAAAWVLDQYWDNLPQENNYKVRLALIRFGLKMLQRHFWPFYFCRSEPFTNPDYRRFSDKAAKKSILEVFDRKDTTTLMERELRMALLLEVLLWSKNEDDCGEGVISVCLRLIADHFTKETHSRREMDDLSTIIVNAFRTGFDCPLPLSSLDRIVDDELALPYFFDEIRFGPHGEAHRGVISLVEHLINYTIPSRTTRTTIVIRHFHRLQEVFRQIDIGLATYFPEFGAVVIVTPSLLARLDIVLRRPSVLPPYDEGMYDAECIMSLFRFALSAEDSSALRLLLGKGFLTVARFYSRNGINRANYTDTFQSILDLHPEWKGRFKEWTCDGEDGNPTAEYGRSLVLARRLPGQLYVFEEDDDY